MLAGRLRLLIAGVQQMTEQFCDIINMSHFVSLCSIEIMSTINLHGIGVQTRLEFSHLA